MYLPPNTVIAAGPVIIENDKVLLNREKKSDGVVSEWWMFPGGGVENFDISLEETCHREAKEEMGIDIEIIKPLRTLLLKRPDKDGYAILVHYLAKRTSSINPGHETAEWGWFSPTNLPEKTAPNVIEILKDLI
jgi:ADP-ribose pyrophosphatase YjhB (NUDIX family)